MAEYQPKVALTIGATAILACIATLSSSWIYDYAFGAGKKLEKKDAPPTQDVIADPNAGKGNQNQQPQGTPYPKAFYNVSPGIREMFDKVLGLGWKVSSMEFSGDYGAQITLMPSSGHLDKLRLVITDNLKANPTVEDLKPSASVSPITLYFSYCSLEPKDEALVLPTLEILNAPNFPAFKTLWEKMPHNNDGPPRGGHQDPESDKIAAFTTPFLNSLDDTQGGFMQMTMIKHRKCQLIMPLSQSMSMGLTFARFGTGYDITQIKLSFGPTFNIREAFVAQGEEDKSGPVELKPEQVQKLLK